MKYVYLFLFLTSALYAVPLQHTITEGDTLYSLSRKYSIPVDLITKANNIQDAGSLRIGQVLIMPGVHQVVAGDTIYSLARRYNVDQQALLDMNGLASPNALRIGSYLLVPAEAEENAAPAPRVTQNTNQNANASNSTNSDQAARPSGTPISLVNNVSQGRTMVSERFAPLVDYLDSVSLSQDQFYLQLHGARGGFWSPLAGKVVYIGRHRNLGLILLLEIQENKLLGIRGVDDFVVKEGQQIRKGAELGRINQGGGHASLFAYNQGNPWKIIEALAFWKF